ncbi:Uncharacterised protein [Mycobacterium tuberculosis]|uniref:Uncharacterized protein n=1 Tax=Mycobacterium tuberculosis TaxID=1773 RepID=A0A916P8Q8_MYCTX|nr:Uncharacterised protein [Mycobacterium tuberculosis]
MPSKDRASGYPAAANLNHHRARCRSEPGNSMQQQETQRDDVQHYDNRIGAEVQKPLVGIPARANGAQYQHQIENKPGHEDATDFAKHESQVRTPPRPPVSFDRLAIGAHPPPQGNSNFFSACVAAVSL